MNINSSRNSLLRSRNLRSAMRSRGGKISGSRTSRTSGSSGSTRRTTSSSASLTQTRQLAMYEKVEKSAYSIQANVKAMIRLGSTAYTDDETGKKAQENDQNSLLRDIRDFVSDFNEVYSDLTAIGGASNTAFKKTLDSIISSNKAALKEIGITVSSSGELTIDEKALTEADFDKVKALFAKEGSFADKISAKMETIEGAASNSLTTLGKLYGATSTYNKYGTSNGYYNSGYYNYGNYSNYYGSTSGWYF